MAEQFQSPEPIWKRSPGESGPAYQAAVIYFQMGADRSCLAVSKKLGKNVSLMERWSKKWSWVARANAFDAHLEAGELAEFAQRAGERYMQKLSEMQSAQLEKRRIRSSERAARLSRKKNSGRSNPQIR
jgi:hypothetical protein